MATIPSEEFLSPTAIKENDCKTISRAVIQPYSSSSSFKTAGTQPANNMRTSNDSRRSSSSISFLPVKLNIDRNSEDCEIYEIDADKQQSEFEQIFANRSMKAVVTQDKGQVIQWADITLPFDTTSSADSLEMRRKTIIGSGTFGTVIRAVWNPPSTISSAETVDSTAHTLTPVSSSLTLSSTTPRNQGNSGIEVAIKILTVSNIHHSTTQLEFETLRYRAYKEAAIMSLAKRKIKSTDHIIDAYGMIEGTLPTSITSLLHLPPDEIGISLVLRYEGNGSLLDLLNKKIRDRVHLPTREKLRLLLHISAGIAELHRNGIIHGDLKPENILLSSDEPSIPRLADFGLSMIKSTGLSEKRPTTPDNTIDQTVSIPVKIVPRKPIQLPTAQVSQMTNTKRTQGTLVYCAPEMLVNPYQLTMNKTMNACELSSVATASRRTDIYAFAILTWQILTQRRPFSEVKGEAMLCSHVHSDYRPSLEKLPKDIPAEIIDMIKMCWDKDRSKRYTATECYDIFQRSVNSLQAASRTNSITDSKDNSRSLANLVVPLPSFDRPSKSFLYRKRSTDGSDSPVTDVARDSVDTSSIQYSESYVAKTFMRLKTRKGSKSNVKSLDTSRDISDLNSEDSPDLCSIYSGRHSETGDDYDDSSASGFQSNRSSSGTINSSYIPTRKVYDPSELFNELSAKLPYTTSTYLSQATNLSTTNALNSSFPQNQSSQQSLKQTRSQSSNDNLNASCTSISSAPSSPSSKPSLIKDTLKSISSRLLQGPFTGRKDSKASPYQLDNPNSSQNSSRRSSAASSTSGPSQTSPSNQGFNQSQSLSNICASIPNSPNSSFTMTNPYSPKRFSYDSNDLVSPRQGSDTNFNDVVSVKSVQSNSASTTGREFIRRSKEALLSVGGSIRQIRTNSNSLPMPSITESEREQQLIHDQNKAKFYNKTLLPNYANKDKLLILRVSRDSDGNSTRMNTAPPTPEKEDSKC